MSIGNEALVGLIRSRLTQDSRISALAIDVCCADGFVSLIGVVESAEQKKLAVDLVTGMIGVRNVKDELRIRAVSSGAAAKQDDWMTA